MVPNEHVHRPFILLRVLVADGGVAVNESITALLSDIDGLSVFGCVQEATKVMDLIQTVHPDVVILDLDLIELHASSLLLQIKSVRNSPIVIVLSDFDFDASQLPSFIGNVNHWLVKTDCFRLKEIVTNIRLERETRKDPPLE